jgi:nitronate monooxygenase
MDFPQLRIGDMVCQVPVIQGGMGVGISLSGLAAAVANQGAVGVISAAMPGIGEPDIAVHAQRANIRVLKQEIREARRKSRGIIGVNIMVALTHYADMVKTALAEGVDIIFAGAGLPLDLPGYMPPGTKTKLVPIVSSARAAVIICRKWLSRFDYLPDALVVEGPKAGGHVGFKAEQIDNPNFAIEKLFSEVMAAMRPFSAIKQTAIPVIPAGGIFDGGDIHYFLSQGAAGVQMGTRFVATHECDADLAFKQLYVASRAEDMVIIKSPVGLPGRVIRNAFIDAVNHGSTKPFKCAYHCLKTCDPKTTPYCIALALASARKGKFKHGFAFAGQNAYRIREIVSVKELIDSLRDEYLAAAAVEIPKCRVAV